MIKKASNIKILTIFIALSVSSCVPWFSDNKFEKEGAIRSMTYGLFGYDAYKFCNNIDSSFIDKYQSGKNPSRICIRYQYYTCHTTHYCPNLPTETERKKCEQDANDYWLPHWDNAKGDPIKKAEISKKVCDSEALKNS